MATNLASVVVFNNELIFDKIMGYFLQNEDEISSADVRSCRLASTGFLRATSRCFYKSNKALFHIHLDKNNSVDGTTYVSENGKLLDNFVNTVTRPDRLEENVPNFKLKIDADFFRMENYESLCELFNRCGNSLVDLELQLPDDGCSMMFLFPNLSLPKLRHCSVIFSGVKINETASGEKRVEKSHYIYLMQQIFSACQQLQSLSMRCEDWRHEVPYGFDRLVLPATLSSLELCCCNWSRKILELLMRNDLPNLRMLFFSPNSMFEYPLIYKALKNFRKTLTHVRFTNLRDHSGAPKYFNYFHLPVMKKLEIFECSVKGLGAKPYASVLHHKLPKLRKICLENQTLEMFSKWTKMSTFTSVAELVLSLAGERSMFSLQRTISVPAEIVKIVNTTFPNLQTLEITACENDTRGVTTVFQILKRLRTLRINVEGTEIIRDTDSWDAVFLGIPVALAKKLRTERAWSQMADYKKVFVPSIMDLTDLQELVLHAKDWEFPNEREKYTIISDAPFQHAFSKMPQLKNISLAGKFMVSPEAELEWRKGGGEISYSRDDQGQKEDMSSYTPLYFIE